MKILKNRTILGIVCIILSLIICFGITPIFNDSLSQKVEIVRVKTDISEGTQITSNMLESVEVGAYNLPNNVVLTTDTVIGTYALADFSVGDYILSDKVSNEIQAKNSYLYNLDGSKQVISVSISSFANGLSGKLESGDVVSIIAPDYNGLGETVIPAELTYVEVISVTSNSGYDSNTNENSTDDDIELPDTITLLVTPEQSKLLAKLESDGEIHVSLVYRGLTENCEQFLAMQDEILQQLLIEETEETTEIAEEITETEQIEVD
ncbi:MAG: Flp pilus assembly protein CpaB [Clostridia bacterium]